jgi:soluble lytic murein transglycosylase
MKTRRSAKHRLLLLMTFSFAFYAENLMGSFNKAGSVEFASNSTNRRISHARELLGQSYKFSPVQKSTGVVSVNRFVNNVVLDRLDARFKNQAGDIAATVLKESAKRGFDPLFVLAVIQTESHFDPTVLGSFGEIGLMQVKPDTAKWIAQKENIPFKGKASLKNPVVNIRIGVAYMSYLRNKFEGSAYRYVAAYNMGPGNVKRMISQDIPPREYATRVLTNYDMIYRKLIKTDVAAL